MLENGRLDHFRSLKAAEYGSDHRCQLSCYADPANESEYVYLKLTNISSTTNKKGEAKTAEKIILKNLIIPEASYRRLEQMADEAGNAQSEEVESEEMETV